MKFTPIKNEWSLIVGGCGGWVINYYDIHSFVIGGGGYGLVKSPKVTYQGEDQSLSMNYGGLFLEYVMLPKNMIHPSIGGLLGLGSVRFGDVKDTTGIYVIDPAINVMLNVTEFFQAGFQVGYRVVAGVDLPGFSNSDLSNVTVGLLLKFGKFY